ncbi:MAG: tRNA lysidine(34) synthetase TilS [Bacteroidota bacterium]
MLEEFERHIKTDFPFMEDHTFIIACSGGVDSVVLVHLCHQLGLPFDLAHCNFNLRGEESDADQYFVEQLAQKLGRTCHVKSFDTTADKGSIQMRARKLRYTWFQQLIDNKDYGYVLTAHHADDDLETFVINLSRGTGIEGLSGIPALNQNVVRPLLPFSREWILAYATYHDIAWREDSSNIENKYLRNRIRHEIIPRMKLLHPNFMANFLLTRDFLHEASVLQKDYAKTLRQKLFVNQGDTIKIDIEQLRALEPSKAYLYLLFHDFGFTQWQDIVHLMTGMSGKEVHSRTHRLLKNRDHLLLASRIQGTVSAFEIHHFQRELLHPMRLKITEVEKMGVASANTLYVDKEKLNYPLMIRKWQKGDYFYPLGMVGKKKVSKFFKDEKMDVFSKERQWVLCSDAAIVWVIGKRADDRFKVTKATQNIIKMTVQ